MDSVADESMTRCHFPETDALGQAQPDSTDCCAVIVSYNPTEQLSENVKLLTAQGVAVVVVDNGSSLAARRTVDTLEAVPGCDVLRFVDNRGIAAALNAGVALALSNGFNNIFTFDQDSTVSANYVPGMKRTLNSADRIEEVAIVAPQYLDRDNGFWMPLPKSQSGEILEAITSGSMIPAGVFKSIGLFDERLYMDYVDLEYCLRCRAAGLRIVTSREAVLHHSVGRMTPFTIFKTTYYASNHSAARRYYITRNRLYLVVKYRHDGSWVRLQIRNMAVDVVKVILAEQDKLDKLWHMARGAIDALLGRMGRQIDL